MEARAISDDEILRVALPYLQEWEFWRPWHDFVFAVAVGADVTFFLYQIRSVISHGQWEGPSPEPGRAMENRILQLLRERAEQELYVNGGPLPLRKQWESFCDPSFVKDISGGSKRVGDIRKYTNDEITQAAQAIEERFPQIPYAIRQAVEHNYDLEVGDERDLVNVYRWVLKPIENAIFILHPEIDSLDNSSLMMEVYRHMHDTELMRHHRRVEGE